MTANTYECSHCQDTGRIALFLPGSWAPCDWCQTPEPAAEVCEADDVDDDPGALITIAGVRHEIDFVDKFGGGARIECGGETYMVFPDADVAGQAAREFWEQLASDDPAEFRCIVGEENLIAWAMGQHAGPGSRSVASLSEWLDLWLDTPEEHWASYDGEEQEVDGFTAEAEDEIGFAPTVAYRC